MADAKLTEMTDTHDPTKIDTMGPLQLRIMQHIWKHGPMTVNDTHTALNHEPGAPQLAYTTYLTVMRNLARRHFLDQQRSAQRCHLFVPLIDELSYKTAVVKHMRDTLFNGSAGTFAAFLASLA